MDSFDSFDAHVASIGRQRAKRFFGRKLALLVGVMLGVGAMRYVWLTGFDMGADVAMCVNASFRDTQAGREVLLAIHDDACKRMKAHERNPMWQFRRRHTSTDRG